MNIYLSIFNYWPTVWSNFEYDASIVCRSSSSSVTHRLILWLNRRKGSALVLLDRAMSSFYKLSIVTSNLQRFSGNFKCKVAACSYINLNASNYHIVRITTLIVAFDIAAWL